MTDGKYRTIKSLVMDYVHRVGGEVSYDLLTDQVRRHFPKSKWKKTHWAWYKHQILRGRYQKMFSEKERSVLASTRPIGVKAVPPAPPRHVVGPAPKGPQPKDADIKRIGDAILNHVRLFVSLAAGEDADKRFRLNRWVFSRLLQDEVRVKRPIKKHLWESGMTSCQGCSQPFDSLKGVEIHRRDRTLAYSVENCELMCRECHQELG